MANKAPKKSAKKRSGKKPVKKKQGQNRVKIFAIVAGVTVVALIGVIIATVIVNRSSSSEPAVISGSGDIAALLQGIPEENNVLGDPNAPVTMIEFADMKCPTCAKFSTSTMTQIINDYVRPGKLRIVLELQTFVNNNKTPGDTERGARFALAAGKQNKMWTFAELLYKNQPPEDQAYFTDEFLTSVGGNIAGLNVGQAFSLMDSDTVSKELEDAKAKFSASGYDSVPTFQLSKTGMTPVNMTSKALDYNTFKSAIDALL